MTRSTLRCLKWRAAGLGPLVAAAVIAALACEARAGSNPVFSIDVGSATGTPGQVLQIPVTLHFIGQPPSGISATSNEINYEASAPIVPGATGGRPACAVGAAVDRSGSSFTFIPQGCQGAVCDGVDARLVGANNVPIPDGSLLYTCTVTIAADAAPGTYMLTNTFEFALGDNMEALPGTGTNGKITVVAPPLACVGDCDGNNEVSVDELMLGVNINLGRQALEACASMDRDGDGAVSVAELIQAVRAALEGCQKDTQVCEQTAADDLATCVGSVDEAQRACYLGTGSACPPDAPAIATALDTLAADVSAACPNSTLVRGVGWGPSFTSGGLVTKLQAECRAEPASLAVRTFGGPQGVGLVAGSAQATACLTAAHEIGSRLLRDQLALYGKCVIDARGGGACTPNDVDATAAALQQQVIRDVDGACGVAALPGLVAIDSATFADRAAAQARCLTATAHPDPAPLSLDCGPRGSLVDTPRGEYVQVVLDEAEFGTRCGDGSPYAFWIRLAPDGSPPENIVIGMQGGGVCIFDNDCAATSPGLFEAMSDQPETTGTLSNDPSINPFADWTKVYLPYCTQDVFIGGGTTSNFPDITVQRFGAVDTRAALRYVRDVVWRELDRTTPDGYQADRLRVLFGGFSAGGFGTLYNYHWVLDDLQWAHTAAYPDASLALDNGQALGVANLGILLISDTPPLGWGARNYMPPYCFANDCGVGPVLLEATSPRLKAVPEQQFLILSNQVDGTQQSTTFFSSIVDWINAMRTAYCATRGLKGVHYYLPAIPHSVHVISARNELYTGRPVNGVFMRDWLASGFASPDRLTDEVEEGTLVDVFPGVMPFDCPVAE
jgi:hypothetical protein